MTKRCKMLNPTKNDPHFLTMHLAPIIQLLEMRKCPNPYAWRDRPVVGNPNGTIWRMDDADPISGDSSSGWPWLHMGLLEANLNVEMSNCENSFVENPFPFAQFSRLLSLFVRAFTTKLWLLSDCSELFCLAWNWRFEASGLVVGKRFERFSI